MQENPSELTRGSAWSSGSQSKAPPCASETAKWQNWHCLQPLIGSTQSMGTLKCPDQPQPLHEESSVLWVGSYETSPVVSITAAFGDTHPTISARGSNRNTLGASQPCGLSSKHCFQGRHKHKLTTSSSIRVYSLRFLAPDWTENEEFRMVWCDHSGHGDLWHTLSTVEG